MQNCTMRCTGLARFEKTAFSEARSPRVSQIQHRSHPLRKAGKHFKAQASSSFLQVQGFVHMVGYLNVVIL